MRKFKVRLTVHANDLDAFIPEIWAQESLMILEANIIAAGLIHRDFSNEVASFGDVVNTRQPATFTGKRKTDADEVTVQDATATNVPVTLNQHIHTSFLIKDGEESKGFKSLRDEYLVPAVMSLAQMVDEVVLMQSYEFLGNVVGKLGTAPDEDTVIALKEKMNVNKVPVIGRQVIIPPNMEGDLLSVSEFVEADKIGDDGYAIREGAVGRKMGMNFFMSQNAPSVASGNTVQAFTINNGNVAIGSTDLTVDGLSADITAGSWCTIAGDMIPQRITVATGSPTTAITISPGLATAVVDGAAVTVYSPGAVNLTAGYAAAYAKDIIINGFTVAPKIGQLMTFGASAAAKYGLLSTPTTVLMLPNRPLDAAISNADAVGIGPAGEYGFAFHKNALALVSRPLAAPAKGTGALSYVANYKGVGIRVTITYDGEKQGHLVTVDLLCGVKTLNSALGAIILG